MIKIVNKPTKDSEYVGRPTILGNPFKMLSEADRDRVCDLYHDHFHSVMLKDFYVLHELERLEQIYKKTGSLTLQCYCAPKRCHAETIKKYLEDCNSCDLF